MAIKIVGDGKGEERSHAQGDRPQHFVANVEGIVSVAGTLSGEDAVMGIVDWKPGIGGTEGGSQFHALEDEIDSELMAALYSSQVGTNVVFLAYSFFGPLHGNLTFLGEGFHPAMVIVGSLTQGLFADGTHLVDVAKKVDDVLGAGEQGQMAQDDDAIETVIYQGQQAAKQLCKGLHRSLPLTLLRQQNHRTKDRWRSKFQICLGRLRSFANCSFASLYRVAVCATSRFLCPKQEVLNEAVRSISLEQSGGSRHRGICSDVGCHSRDRGGHDSIDRVECQ